MDIFGYPWIYPISEKNAMDIHAGFCWVAGDFFVAQ
jgi:hypothetical protein